MHSAEHILNQTMVRMFRCERSFNAHIEKRKSKCDYHLPRGLAEEEIRSVESTVNQIIQADLAVTEESLPREECEGRFNLARLPEHAGHHIRIVKVGDYDACPCSGRHVASTREIGAFHIISHDFHEGVLRIRFRLNEKDGAP